MLGWLISLLTCCAEKPARPPEKPGVSLPLSYPVLLAGERNLKLKDDETSLITTSESSGGDYYGAFAMIDSQGMEYVVKKTTAFGRKAVWRDMGTSSYQVFLDLKSKGRIGLEKAKAMALAAATAPEGAIGPNGKEIASARIGSAKSFADLIEACRDPWRPIR